MIHESLNKFLPACVYSLYRNRMQICFMCVCFTKIFNKHLSMSEQKFCAADVNKFSNKFSARERERERENWTNDTQMCCWNLFSTFAHVYFTIFDQFMCCLSHFDCEYLMHMDGIVNSFTLKKIPFSFALCQFYHM